MYSFSLTSWCGVLCVCFRVVWQCSPVCVSVQQLLLHLLSGGSEVHPCLIHPAERAAPPSAAGQRRGTAASLLALAVRSTVLQHDSTTSRWLAAALIIDTGRLCLTCWLLWHPLMSACRRPKAVATVHQRMPEKDSSGKACQCRQCQTQSCSSPVANKFGRKSNIVS